MPTLEEIQRIISGYYAKGGDYGKAGELYATETGNQYGAWHDLVKKRDRLQEQAKYQSPANFTNAGGPRSWDDVMAELSVFNKLPQEDKIIAYQKKHGKGKNYAIVNKQTGKMTVYSAKTNAPIYSEGVGLGANRGDAQTVTKYIDVNQDGKITDADKIGGKFKVDWNAGNMSTGAGRFYVSNIDRRGYGGQPIINMMNESQYEDFLRTGIVNNVATSIHCGGNGSSGRVSNGCIRASSQMLSKAARGLVNDSEVYILPEDDGNEFVYENGKLNFKPNAKKKYSEYVDAAGRTQRGQGINRSVNTLNYEPISIGLNEEEFKKHVFQKLDLNDTAELEKTTKPFIEALQSETNKKKVMKAAKINSDVYNEIAKTTFGIYGTETNFGDTHDPIGNLLRLFKKLFSRSSSSSPDYKAKRLIAGSEKNSVGLTQIRFSFLDAAEKKALEKVGITSNKDFMDPKKAAIGTATVLGVRYNQQLNEEQKKDIMEYLPKKWNTRENYSDRVKKNARYLTMTVPNYGEVNGD